MTNRPTNFIRLGCLAELVLSLLITTAIGAVVVMVLN